MMKITDLLSFLEYLCDLWLNKYFFAPMEYVHNTTVFIDFEFNLRGKQSVLEPDYQYVYVVTLVHFYCNRLWTKRELFSF